MWGLRWLLVLCFGLAGLGLAERQGICAEMDATNVYDVVFGAIYEDAYVPLDVLYGFEVVTIQVKQRFGFIARMLELICKDGGLLPVVLPTGVSTDFLPDALPEFWEAYAVYGEEAADCERWGAAYSSKSLSYEVGDLALLFAERPARADGFALLMPLGAAGELADLNALGFGPRPRVEGVLYHAVQVLLLPEGSSGVLRVFERPGFVGQSCEIGRSD